MTDYEAVIGLEIHVQLSTRTKMFCGCELTFGEPPNTRTCPVCLGLPGTLPVTNERAVEFGIALGLALGCEIAPRSVFHRKNYFYPDLPKGYQISQYDEPLCVGGHLGEVRIHRVHLEEDAAKLIHAGASGRIHGAQSSVVDFNRGGTPLCEIVTEPDLTSGAQAREWLTLLRATVRRTGVSDVNMEEGSLRVDANISIRPVGTTALGVKTELKNMNSFRFVERGINAEIERQTALLHGGGEVVQETLHYDPQSGSITSLRSKEQAHDYRYFPEPDLLPVVIDPALIERIRETIPELPAARAERFEELLTLPRDAARTLAFRTELGDFFEAALRAAPQDVDAIHVANWVVNEVVARLGETDPAASKLTPAALGALVGMVVSGEITGGAGRQVLDRLVADGGDPEAIVANDPPRTVGGGDELRTLVQAALDADPDVTERLRGGDMKPINVVIGHVMRETKGRADGRAVTALVRELLGA